MKFLKRIIFFVVSFIILSILYIPNTGYAAWSGSAYSPGETLNPECAPTDSGCTVSLSFTASSGNIGIGSTTPWGKLSVNPNGITGPAFVIGSSTGTSFVVDNGGSVGIGTSDFTSTTYDSTTPSLQIAKTGSSASLSVVRYSNNALTPRIMLSKSRSSVVGSFSILQDSDQLGRISFTGDDGTDIDTPGAYIQAIVSGTPALNSMPTAIQFYTHNGTSIAEKMRVTPTGTVGIGTTTPRTIFDIASASAPTLSISNTTNGTWAVGDIVGALDFYSSDANDNFPGVASKISSVIETDTAGSNIGLALSTASIGTLSEKLRISSTGNVGIGSTSPYAKLAITNTGTNPSFVVEDATSPDTTPFIIDASGNVGIGTSSPSYTLDVRGPLTGAVVDTVANFSSNADYMGLTVNNTKASGCGQSDFFFAKKNVLTWQFGSDYAANCTKDFFIYDQTRTKAPLYLASNGDIRLGNDTYAGTQYLTLLQASGNLGIGISAPLYKLDVDGSMRLGASSGSIQPVLGRNTGGGLSINTSGSVSSSNNLLTVANNGGTALVTVLGNGNVGIGTTSPASKLAITQSANTPAGGLWIAETGNTDFRSVYMSDTSGTLSFFGGDTAGALNTATLSSAGTWTNASDRSYKENIANLDTKYNLNTLLSIQPRFYTMKGSGKPQIGFIAQELQPILPEVVEGTEGSLGISYGNMVALLVQAIKDINVKVDNIANKLSGVFKTDSVEANKVSTKELCVDDVCVSKEQFREMVVRSGMMPNIIYTNENIHNSQNSVISTPNTSNGTSTSQVENNATTTQVVENTATTTQVIENNTNNQNTTPAEQITEQNSNNSPVENQDTPAQ